MKTGLSTGQLSARIAELETRIGGLRKQGILTNCRIDSAKPGGTASPGASAQYRLRYKKPLITGKKSRYIPAGEVERYRAAIARGKELMKLERRLSYLQQMLAQCSKPQEPLRETEHH